MIIGMIFKFIVLLIGCLAFSFIFGGTLALIDMDLETNENKD